MPHSARWISLSSLVVCLYALTGCGGTHPTANVSGNVTFQGKPITFGLITFQSEVKDVPNSVRSGEIRNGKFSVQEIPVGNTKIAVSSTQVDPKPGPSPTGAQVMEPPPVGPYIAIPQKYNLAATSGLTFEVKNGPQTKDFALTP